MDKRVQEILIKKQRLSKSPFNSGGGNLDLKFKCFEPHRITLRNHRFRKITKILVKSLPLRIGGGNLQEEKKE